jgi:hypothetical protein
MTTDSYLVFLRCKRRGSPLAEPPERDHGEWIVRCFACGVVNIIQPTLEIIGYGGSQ